MSLVFYYAPMSTASVTYQILEELGVPYEKVTLDLRAGDARKPAYLALNPNGKVPLIVHDGTPIFESSAITIYLGETFGVEKGLFPAAGPARGQAIQWLVWCHVTLGEALSRHQHNVASYVPAEQHNAKAAESAAAQVETLLGVLDKALTERSFLVGERFSLVDSHVSSFVDYVRMCKFDLAKHPHVAAWVARCNDRPAVKRAAD